MTIAASQNASHHQARPDAPLGYLHRVLGALLTALAVALVGYAGNVILLFGANGASASVLVSLGSYFLLGALMTFVALFVAGLISAFRRWYWALLAGLVCAPIGIVLGLVMMLAGSGAPFTGSLWLQIAGTLVGVNFIFWFAVTVTAPTLGPVVWRAATRMRSHTGAPVALVRLPASVLVPVLADGTSAADADSADEQWDGVVAALGDAGWNTVEVPVADTAPESVFVNDTVVLLGQTAVVTAGAQGDREAELDDVELRLREYPLELERIEAPAALSGADVLVVGETVYVAVGERTNSEGVRRLRQIARPLGFTVVALPPLSGASLAVAASALPDGTVLADVDRLGAAAGVISGLRGAPEPEGASVIVLDDSSVLVSAAAPRTAAMLTELGFTTTQVAVTEFEALGGGLGRLAVRLG